MRNIAPLAFLIGSLALPAARAQERTSIAFESYEKALASSTAQRRVVALYFTASWCGVCRKMQANSLQDPEVVKASQRFSWGKVDIDEQPEIAASFGIRGVPALLLLNDSREVLARQSGYVDASSLSALLKQHQGSYDAHSRTASPPSKQASTLVAGRVTPARALAVLEQLAGLRRDQHRELSTLLLQLKAAAWPSFLSGLESPQLAVRAAAFELLRESTGASLAFDPFAPKAERDAQVRAWRELCNAQTAR